MHGYTIDNFDFQFYIDIHLDLRENGIITQLDAWAHWTTYGHLENRHHRLLQPCSSLTTHHIKVQKMGIIARWHITARFGHKGKVIKGLQSWIKDIGSHAGFSSGRIISGRIGAKENLVEWETEHESIAALEKRWSNFGEMPQIAEKHKQWSIAQEPFMQGTTHWEIFGTH